MYTSACYLGITEIVKPVYIESKLDCVIYLGNFLVKGTEQDVTTRVTKMHRHLGVGIDKLMLALKSVRLISQDNLHYYENMVDALSEIIELVLKNIKSFQKNINPAQ